MGECATVVNTGERTLGGFRLIGDLDFDGEPSTSSSPFDDCSTSGPAMWARGRGGVSGISSITSLGLLGRGMSFGGSFALSAGLSGRGIDSGLTFANGLDLATIPEEALPVVEVETVALDFVPPPPPPRIGMKGGIGGFLDTLSFRTGGRATGAVLPGREVAFVGAVSSVLASTSDAGGMALAVVAGFFAMARGTGGFRAAEADAEAEVEVEFDNVAEITLAATLAVEVEAETVDEPVTEGFSGAIPFPVASLVFGLETCRAVPPVPPASELEAVWLVGRNGLRSVLIPRGARGTGGLGGLAADDEVAVGGGARVADTPRGWV